MQADLFLKLIFYFSGIVPWIVFSILSAIEIRRVIQKLRWVYNDWLIITWIISYLGMFISMVIYIIISLLQDKDMWKLRWVSYNFLWFFLRLFEMLTLSYQILLIIYYTKLYGLHRGKSFEQVKRTINRWELFLIVIISFILILQLWLTIIPQIIIYSDKNWKSNSETKDISKFSTLWILCNRVRGFAFYYYQVMNTIQGVGQCLIVWYVKRTMRNKLYYYYKRAMRELIILLISHLALLISNIVANFGLLDAYISYSLSL